MADFQRWSDRYLVKTLLCLTTAYFYAGGSSGTGFYLDLSFITPPRRESSGERGERNVVLKSDGLIVYKLMLDNEDADCKSEALCSS